MGIPFDTNRRVGSSYINIYIPTVLMGIEVRRHYTEKDYKRDLFLRNTFNISILRITNVQASQDLLGVGVEIQERYDHLKRLGALYPKTGQQYRDRLPFPLEFNSDNLLLP